ncbi:transglutaminase-like domain-containing protein [Methylobacterium soli]|uniref:Transglutaminase family protein n=1 Tax=Methylobacterium soli TaxID=553447 RepID=A0A6L3SZ05_9HYPH|nr:transglutaminase family protein [Methylobacterium soli]KAB1078545.1 transglutaminase family protein [Methylobacterium soli]
MQIRTGYSIAYDTFGPTPMNLLLSVHPSRTGDLLTPDAIRFDPPVPSSRHVDAFGNVCTRLVAPGGRITMSADFVIADSGLPDHVAPDARQIAVQDLPDEVLVFLLGSRYCDTDKLSAIAWSLFGNTAEGWSRVQAIVDYVHERITFNYQEADATRTAFDGYTQQRGVCRDFAHLAVAFCRCMNIPARYCTGYLGDIGIAPVPDPMDFSAWFEVYLDGPQGPRWYTFDARHNTPRIGRIVIARGRDATDVAISTSFGSALLARFEVHTDEVPAVPPADLARAA